LLYGFLKIFCYFLFKLWLRLEVHGEENIPQHGAVVLAINHLSLLDPPVVGEAANRRVHYMAKAELFENPVFGYIIKCLGVFPVRRGAADKTAIKTGISYLKAQEVVAVFPEGTRSKNGKLGRVGSGAFMMAVAAKAEIVPVLIEGTDLKRHRGWPKVKVTFGRTIAYDKSQRATKECLAALNARWINEMIAMGAQTDSAVSEEKS